MSWVPGGNWKTAQVFLTDEKIVERPPAPKAPPPHPERECDGEDDGDPRLAETDPAPAPHKAPAGAPAGRGEPEAEPAQSPAPTPEAPLPSTASDFTPPAGSLAAELDGDAPEAPAIPAPSSPPSSMRSSWRVSSAPTKSPPSAAPPAKGRKPPRRPSARSKASSREAGAAKSSRRWCAPSCFPTPPVLADRLVTAAGVRGGMRVLEPSAGTGALAGECITRGATVVLVEVNADAARFLEMFRGSGERSRGSSASVTPTFSRSGSPISEPSTRS